MEKHESEAPRVAVVTAPAELHCWPAFEDLDSRCNVASSSSPAMDAQDKYFDYDRVPVKIFNARPATAYRAAQRPSKRPAQPNIVRA